MGALDQYIALYEANRALIDGNAPAALNRLRPAALAALRRYGRLPGGRDEGYSGPTPESMFAPDYGINIGRLPFDADVARSFRCDVPNVSTLLAVVANDCFVPSATLLRNLPEGVTVASLADMARREPEWVEAHLGRLSADSDAPAALNTLLMQDGVVVRVGVGVRCDKAIQIVNIFNAAAPTMGVRRLLVVLERDAAARLIVCDHSQSPDHSYLSSSVTEVFLAPGSSLDYCDIEESTALTSRMSQMFVRQEEGSALRANASSLSVGSTRNEYRIDITGPHASTDLAAMAITGDSQRIASASRIRHLAPRSKSNQTFKYLLDGQSRGFFSGLIYVDPAAHHTEAYQSDRNILASPQARMQTDPQLEIYCDEVKCSHGAATGQLDAAALFYMRTRGIPEAEARMMLMQAFMADIVDRVAVDGLRDRLRHLVERRLSGQQASCSNCQTSCPK